MTEHYLRYLTVACGTGLVALGWILDKLPANVGEGAILILLGIAGADMIKHRNDGTT